MDRDVRIPNAPTIRTDTYNQIHDVIRGQIDCELRIPDVPAERGEVIDKTPAIYVLPSHEAFIHRKYDSYWNAATDV